MLIKILGILDIILAILFWIFGVFNIGILSNIIFILGIILLIKGVIFMTQFSIASVLDLTCALIIIYSVSNALPKIFVIIISLFLLQKGIFSMLS